MYALSLILAGLVAGADPHAAVNPVYAELVQKGVSPSGQKFFPLPPPLMPDGLNAAEQKKIITDLGKPGQSYERLTRKSVVAPHIVRIDEVKGADATTIVRNVDIYFVAYGDMDVLTKNDFLSNAFQEKDAEGAEGATLTPEQLAERSIVIAPESKDYEGYGRTTFELINRVELSVVGRSYWSRGNESLVTAAVVDPRFTGDAQDGNVWRPIKPNRVGKLEKGPPQPYRGAGVYMKITQLAEPAGALFVEAHVVYNEPQGWFDGKDLLRAKISVVAQEKVRDMRQEILRAAR